VRGFFESDPIKDAHDRLKRYARKYAGAYLDDSFGPVLEGAERDMVAAAFDYVVKVQESESKKRKRTPRAQTRTGGK
jgi:hypothetical protein